MDRSVLITGAAGNLGGFLARHLLGSDLELRLMYHHRPIAEDITQGKDVRCFPADLARPETLREACRGVDCIVHFAGVLFRPRPERFLPRTNTEYVRNLVGVAVQSGVKRFILVSFPQVEGPTTPEHPATGRRPAENDVPISAHARTRLQAEHCVFCAAEASTLEPVILRAGTIYGRGVLMVEAARWLMQRRLLAVWPQPTWYHFLSIMDFLAAAEAAVRKQALHGVYNVGDDQPATIQDFLDRAADHWRLPRPWRVPKALVHVGAACVEFGALVLRTPAPFTRDFVRLGMVPHVMDTARMRRELLPSLTYPTINEGMSAM
ncbi:MAG: NAD(P)-dependent oxidoreductase [Acidobacteria bacterium]|nr:NAD(P)-dependent oxidoreductase [Acidobacteriota bacterium]